MHTHEDSFSGWSAGWRPSDTTVSILGHMGSYWGPELGTCGIYYFFKIESTYFLKPIPCNFFFAPVLFKKPTPSQINLIESAKDIIFHFEKVQKYRKCPALLGTYCAWRAIIFQ